MHRHAFKTAVISSALMFMTVGSASAADEHRISSTMVVSKVFTMVVSKAASTCLPKASAKVQITSDGAAEDMSIVATGLPLNTNFGFFVIQVPRAPFGLSWYEGDVRSDVDGDAVQHFRGRFSIETFSVAPGSAPAPVIFKGDASVNPPFNPIQTYHLGLWFNSPTDAQRVGCPNATTPFNGAHNAGIQVLNTSNFPDFAGPLCPCPYSAGIRGRP
jgi:hypothetical protein